MDASVLAVPVKISFPRSPVSSGKGVVRSAFLMLAVLSSCGIVHAGDNTPDVPLTHGVYRTLDRYDAHGWLDSAASQTRPYTRLKVAGLLINVLRNRDAQAAMSGTERGILRRHLASFRPEAARLGYAAPEAGTGVLERLAGALFSRRDFVCICRNRSALPPATDSGSRRGQGEGTVSQTHIGAIVRGTLGDRLGFRARHFEAREWSTLPA